MSECKRVWPRPVLVTLPELVSGVSQPNVSLDGVWKISLNPVKEYWKNEVSTAAWSDIEVPSQTTIKGFFPENKTTYAYKTSFAVPADFADKTVILRFDAVNCYTKVFIDGQFAQEHYGGYNGWDADITQFVEAGKTHILTVGVQDRMGEMTQFSMGGIIRSVHLIALPKQHIERLHVQTDLDSEYKNAVLRIFTKLSDCGKATLELTLTAPCGKEVDLDGNIPINDCADHEFAFPVKAPMKWDSEHPNLYVLTGKLIVDGQVTEVVSKKIGFRNIEIRGDQMFVNGEEIKLRGADREEVHPLRGRAITRQDIEDDVRLFKEANVNFIRTSHYNPSQYFLDLCDEQGMYVEEETSISFVGQGQDQTCDDPEFTPQYMNQFAEMIEMDRSRPCVIMWSLANESIWGDNFRMEANYAKAEDPSRPIIFSYPVTIQDDREMVDIWSAHYGELETDPSIMVDNHYRGEHYGHRPVLHDEYIHVPCYTLHELARDPAVRDFYGESVKQFWDKIYDTQGALGGAIWGGIDEVHWDGRGMGAEWGIFDGFRRVKPEHWLTKKGYSPIRIENQPIGKAHSGVLRVPIYNRYNHTNLNEITVSWSIAGRSGTVHGPDLAPRQKGSLEITVGNVDPQEPLKLIFTEPNGMVCEEYCLSQVEKKVDLPQFSGAAPTIREEAADLTISGENFRIVFSKQSGLITEGSYRGKNVIKSGPYLNLVGMQLGEWKLSNLSWALKGNIAEVTLSGAYGKVLVDFVITIDGEGLMKTTYTVKEIPYNSPRSMTMIVGVNVGGYAEVGVSFILTNEVDELTWNKGGLWDAYPDDHIGRLSGMAKKLREGGYEFYPHAPTWDWKDDIKNYSLYGYEDAGGRGTKDFTSSKTSLYEAAAAISDQEVALRAFSDGTDAVRMEMLWDEETTIDDRDPRVKYYGNWMPHEDIHGCYGDTETVSNTPGDYAEIEFEGTGISWISTKYLTYGMADVYLDGQQVRKNVDLFARMASGVSRGYERSYRNSVYSVAGLEPGRHSLRIVVTGNQRGLDGSSYIQSLPAYNCYVGIDCFRLLDGANDGDVKMIINNEWNFNELAWGDYVKPPIMVEDGYTKSVYVKLDTL